MTNRRIDQFSLFSPGSDEARECWRIFLDSTLSSLAIVTMLVPDVIYVCDCYVSMKAREGEREIEKERERSPQPCPVGLGARPRNGGAARGPTSH